MSHWAKNKKKEVGLHPQRETNTGARIPSTGNVMSLRLSMCSVRKCSMWPAAADTAQLSWQLRRDGAPRVSTRAYEMMGKIILFGVVLFPFQNLSLPLAQSRYDLTAFILLAVSIYFTFKNGRVSERIIFYMLAFVLMQLLVFAFINIAPYYRLISGIVWIGGLFLMLLSAKKFNYRKDAVYKIIMYVMLLSAFYIFFQSFFLGESRPMAWFSEPSYAGLALYSAAAGSLGTIIIVKMPTRTRFILCIAFLVLISAALLTVSMHFVTFLLAIILVYFLQRPKKKFLQISIKRTIAILIIGSIIAFISSYLISLAHYADRLNITDPTNISLLVWLDGFDQAKASISNSPILGNGLGSTGYFGNFANTDAYSLAFRLVIEIGLPLFVIFMIYFVRRLNIFRSHLVTLMKVPASQSIPIVFNFIFATSVIIGALIKEPLYSHSSLYLGVFLFASSVPLSVMDHSKRVSSSFKPNPLLRCHYENWT